MLTFDESVSICKHGKGRAKLAYPRTMLEAFSYLGYARERGVHSFWSDKPPEGGLMVWSGLDGERLNITAGERRCVLVSTVSTDIHGAMYAELALRRAPGRRRRVRERRGPHRRHPRVALDPTRHRRRRRRPSR